MIVGILDITAGELPVQIHVHPLADKFRIKVLYAVHLAVTVHLGLHHSGSITHHQGGHSALAGHLGVVGTECRGNVDNTCGALVRGHVVSGNHSESTLVRTHPGDQLLVAHTYKVGALI